ncbi:MAG TPA: hypothetical protein VG433_15750, partial [Pirellulales bacterium]|nr:hypothetical protein [Pirellulales bacterium]
MDIALEDTGVTDAGVEQLTGCPTIGALTLSWLAITDRGVESLSKFDKLWFLALRETAITDKSVATLKSLTHLRQLFITNTNISQTGFDELKSALPNAKIDWSPKPPVVAATAPAPAVPEVPFNPALERKAAEWVISVGGNVRVKADGQAAIPASRIEQLPAGQFKVIGVDLSDLPTVNDAGLAHLDGLSHLLSLNLFNTAITSEAGRHIHLHPWLDGLNVPRTGFGDAGAEHIATLPRLTAFDGGSTPITDRGAQSLARIESLRSIRLYNTAITDTGVAYLSQLHLVGITLDGSRVTDACLVQLAKCKELGFLALERTSVTDAGLLTIARMEPVRWLWLRDARITARSIETLAGMKLLKELRISNPPISQAGYDKLQAALPACKIDWSPAHPADVAVAAPTKIVPLDRLNRLAVPAESERQKAAEAVKEVFGDEIAHAKKAEDKQALAEKLLKKAQETRDEPASAYAMLEQARTLAVDAADAPLLARIATELGSRFDVEPLELLADDLEKANQKSHPSAAFKTIAETALEQVDDALAADQFPVAKRFSDVALSAARKAKDPVVLKSAIDRNKGMATIKQQWEAAEEAKKTLAKTPDDPDANLAVGRYLCFVKGDWPAGFAKLAKGSDATLKDLGEKSAADPQDAAGQADLGEAWAKAADAAKGKSKAELQASARYWLAKALPAATGLSKAKIEQRLKQLDGPAGAAASKAARRPSGGTLAQQLARDRA